MSFLRKSINFGRRKFLYIWWLDSEFADNGLFDGVSGLELVSAPFWRGEDLNLGHLRRRHGDESDIGGLSSGARWLVTGEAAVQKSAYNARRNVVTVPMTYSTFPHSKASEVKTLECMETSPVNKFPPSVIAKATEFAAMPEATFFNTKLDRGTFDVC
ncbi:hypothetical protein QQ045_010995 [Rhodiola kirilowii]